MKFDKLGESQSYYNIGDYCYGVLMDKGLTLIDYPRVLYLGDEVYYWLTARVGCGNREGWWQLGCEWLWAEVIHQTSPDVSPYSCSEAWMYFKDPRVALVFEAIWA